MTVASMPPIDTGRLRHSDDAWQGSMNQDPILVWVVGIATSLIAGALWATLARFVARNTNGRGELAGYWYQVTYDPDNDENVWSVEVIEVKHHADRITGTMWRVWPEAFLRRWSFSGEYSNLLYRALYKRTREDRSSAEHRHMREHGASPAHAPRRNGSGSGFMKLYKDDAGCCQGRFVEEGIKSVEFGPQIVEFGARLEWIKFQGAGEDFVIQLLLHDADKFSGNGLPPRIRRRLQWRIEGRTIRSDWLFNFAMSSWIFNPAGPLVAQMAKRQMQEERLRQVRSLERLDPDNPSAPHQKPVNGTTEHHSND